MAKPFPAIAVTLLLSIGACGTNPGSYPAEPAKPEPAIQISGELGFRDGARPEPGSVATLLLSDFAKGAADGSRASTSIELDGSRTFIPFELEIPLSKLAGGGQFALRAEVHDPRGKNAWTSSIAQLIDPTRTETNVGVLILVPTANTPPSTTR